MAAISDKIKKLKDHIGNLDGEEIGRDFIAPCLNECVLYRRGTGFFNISALHYYISAINGIMENETKIEILCSPQNLSREVYNAIEKNANDSEKESIIKEFIDKFIGDAIGIEKAYHDKKAAEQILSYFIAKGIIDIKFAIPIKDIDFEVQINDDEEEPAFDNLAKGNMYHIKDGYFKFEGGAKIAFKGSANESRAALKYNQESFEIFKSWIPEDVKRLERIINQVDRDHGLLEKKNDRIRLYPIGNEILKYLKEHAPTERPSRRKIISDVGSIENVNIDDQKWRHQDEAVKEFLEKKNGILAMATGSGKTWTSFKIIDQLFEHNLISQVIITMRGNSLLAQWLDGLYEDYKAHDKGRIIFKHFGGEAGGWDLEGFLNNPKGNLLMITNDKLSDALTKIDEQEASKTLIIYDEAHNLGSETRRNKTSKLHEKFKYRLGLTATPDRLFDEEGTKFLKDEIGPVIFKFTLEQAIERGILVEFDYDVLKYNLSVDENKKIHSIIKAMNSQHTTMTKEEGWIKMANVRKEAEDKIVLFSKYLEENSKVLDKCIIFVNTKEYGGRVVDVISKHITNYNTFYEQDNDENLQKLRDGTIQCLVTCHKVSEGIDIKALNTVILFSSSVDPRETIQRIGRTLRIDDKLPDKRAFILDFCDEDQKKDTEADVKRFKWLSKLSNTKRKKNG